MATQRKRPRLPVVGKVLTVTFSGAGKNSGEVLVVVKPASSDAIGFGIWMDAKPPVFFNLMETAIRAMWAEKTVAVTSEPTDGLARIKALKVISAKR